MESKSVIKKSAERDKGVASLTFVPPPFT